MISRRGFFGLLAAAAAVDPERLLWIPGRKKIFIPPARANLDLTVATIQEAIAAMESGGVAYLLQPRHILVVNPDGRHHRIWQLFERPYHPSLAVGDRALFYDAYSGGFLS